VLLVSVLCQLWVLLLEGLLATLHLLVVVTFGNHALTVYVLLDSGLVLKETSLEMSMWDVLLVDNHLVKIVNFLSIM
jgi:hypothetical protein